MIWNPWKEIKRLRGQVDLYNEMAMDAGQKVVFLQSDKEVLQGRIDALLYNDQKTVEALHATLDRADKLHIGLLDIIAEERPTSNATVRRMARIARTALGE